MRGFKRLCTVIFVLADLFALAALALTWYGPWTDAATALLYLEPYAIAILVCLVVSALGLLVLLVRDKLYRHYVPDGLPKPCGKLLL